MRVRTSREDDSSGIIVVPPPPVAFHILHDIALRTFVPSDFPAEWGVGVLGSGDHPLSEPEVDSLVRAVRARPNVCGYNAFHTSGGFLLCPSGSQPDSKLPPYDLFVYKELGKVMSDLTTYPVHSVYEDLTWDKSKCIWAGPPTTGRTSTWACCRG